MENTYTCRVRCLAAYITISLDTMILSAIIRSAAISHTARLSVRLPAGAQAERSTSGDSQRRPRYERIPPQNPARLLYIKRRDLHPSNHGLVRVGRGTPVQAAEEGQFGLGNGRSKSTFPSPDNMNKFLVAQIRASPATGRLKF